MDTELLNENTVHVQEDIIESIGVAVEPEPSVVGAYYGEKQVDVENVETVTIEVEESVGWAGGDATRHGSLYGRDEQNQHPITAITGLKERLEDIEAIKPVYSNANGVANYYKWKDAKSYGSGYFVSLSPQTDTIQRCEGSDIFGVTVDGAGFIGGHTSHANSGECSLVITSGIVDVRCESDVLVGDFVISNARGVAKKTTSNAGYKVTCVNNKYGVLYASIFLGVQADITDGLSKDLEVLSGRVRDNEINTITAVNTANAAYNKANQSIEASEEAIRDALDAINKADEAIGNTNDMNDTLSEIVATTAKASAIAQSAVTTAETLKTEAVNRANDAWAKAENVSKDVYSLVAKIDDYSVGEYSQAYGLTIEQASSILKEGMIYVPTQYLGSDFHTEQYDYTNKFETVESIDDVQKNVDKIYYDKTSELYWYYEIDEWESAPEMPSYTREFAKGFMYLWGYLDDVRHYGWITSQRPVFFSHTEPGVIAGETTYWYADSDEVFDRNGAAGVYDPYTLYKWEDDHWLAVATLSGNVNNRALSEIAQTTNNIAFGVTNTRGCIAGLDLRLTDTEASVHSVVAWPMDDETHYLATISQVASEDGATLALSAVRSDGVTALSGANIVLSDDKDGSFISLDADRINFDTKEFCVKDSANNGNVLLRVGNNKVDIGEFTVASDATKSCLYSNQTTYSYQAGQIGQNGVYLGTDGIGLGNGNFYVNNSGYLYAQNGQIAGFKIDSETIRSGDKEVHNDKKSGVYIGPEGIGLGEGTFYVTKDGYLGATSGTIAGFTFDGSAIKKIKYSYNDSNPGVYIGTNGIGLGANKFWVTSSGELYAEIGKIGGFKINGTSLYSNKTSYTDPADGIYIGTNGIALGTNSFSVSQYGFLSATKGTIGGWTLDETSLQQGTLGNDGSFCLRTSDLDSNVTISDKAQKTWRLTIGTNFGVDSSGTLYATGAKLKNIEADGGTFTELTGGSGGFKLELGSSLVLSDASKTYLFMNTGDNDAGGVKSEHLFVRGGFSTQRDGTVYNGKGFYDATFNIGGVKTVYLKFVNGLLVQAGS